MGKLALGIGWAVTALQVRAYIQLMSEYGRWSQVLHKLCMQFDGTAIAGYAPISS